MTREEIRNKVFKHFKGQIEWAKKNPNQAQQFQMGQILSLFPFTQNVQQRWYTPISKYLRNMRNLSLD